MLVGEQEQSDSQAAKILSVKSELKTKMVLDQEQILEDGKFQTQGFYIRKITLDLINTYI